MTAIRESRTPLWSQHGNSKVMQYLIDSHFNWRLLDKKIPSSLLLFWFAMEGTYVHASLDWIASKPLLLIVFVSFLLGKVPQVLLSIKLNKDRISLNILASRHLLVEIVSRSRLKSPPMIKFSITNLSVSSFKCDRNLLRESYFSLDCAEP